MLFNIWIEVKLRPHLNGDVFFTYKFLINSLII